MAGYNGPAFQRMVSWNRPEFVQDALAERMRVFGATSADVEARNITEVPELERRHGMTHHSRYELHWFTYTGWKVYMYSTGCIASDPAYERANGLAEV